MHVRYFCETDEDKQDVVAAAGEGSMVVPWRVDSSGAQWYKLLPPVTGKPISTDEVALVDDALEEELSALRADAVERLLAAIDERSEVRSE